MDYFFFLTFYLHDRFQCLSLKFYNFYANDEIIPDKFVRQRIRQRRPQGLCLFLHGAAVTWWWGLRVSGPLYQRKEISSVKLIPRLIVIEAAASSLPNPFS